MKEWASDHPKAKLMARKRAVILEAARAAFLTVGYDGASMESIAAAAGVSIMTLYRHAESKDRLFAGVMLNECERAHGQGHGQAIDLALPLRDVLIQIAMQFQERLASPDTIALFRTVMVEVKKFPHVAEAAYRGFIEAWVDEIDEYIGSTDPFGSMPGSDRRALVADFIDDLVGIDFLRSLLGIFDQSSDHRRMQHSTLATNRLLSNVNLS